MGIGHRIFGNFAKIKGNINVKFTENRLNIFFWVAGFSFLLSIIAICCVFVSNRVVVENQSIILIFVGILATFIVVSNYIQVKEIERKFDREIKEIKDELTENFDKKILEYTDTIKKISDDSKFYHIVIGVALQKSFESVKIFALFLNQISDINDKNYFSLKFVELLKDTKLQMSEFDVAILNSLFDTTYDYGGCIPNELEEWLNNNIQRIK